MDIKQAERIAEEHGGRLLGYHTIPFPVYQIFVSYETFDDDPFFPIRKTLLQWVLERQDTPQGKENHIKFVASMLGMDYRLVSQVYQNLKEENYIVPDPTSGVYRVTDDAKRKFILPESRPSKQVTGTVILDGKTFDFLPSEAYGPILDDEVNIWEYVRHQNVEPHIPIDMSADSRSPEITRMEKELDSHKMRLDEIGLKHQEGWNFKITGIEKRNVSPVYLVYVGKDSGRVDKLPYIGDVQLNTPAIGKTGKFTFSIVKDWNDKSFVSVNLGYNSNDDAVNQCVGYCMDNGVQHLVNKRYGLEKQFPINLEKNGCFWQIDITEDMLKSALNPGNIISDCLYWKSAMGKQRPCLIFNVNYGKSEGLLIIDAVQNIDVYLKLQNAIQKSKDEKRLEEELNSITPDWREKLIAMGHYAKLEDLDIIKYITPLDND